MGETEVEIPWMDEPLPVGEAVEVVAQAFNEDADETEELEDRIERLEGRLDDLEGRVESESDSEVDGSSDDESEADGDDSGAETEADSELSERVETLERCVDLSNDATQVTCPSCESSDDVLKDGVAAAVLVRKGSLSDKNVGALNQESHLCLSCRKAFTPCKIGGDGGGSGDDDDDGSAEDDHEALR